VGRLSLRSAGPHVAAAGIFAALAAAWISPVAPALSSTIPGLPGDNLAFLWNVWWAREAVASGHDPLFTPLLFAPVGVDLTQNTHTALPALGAAALLGWLSPAAALNLIVWSALALSGLFAYALGWRITRRWSAALVCGLVFGGSPFIAARLQGHFNLIHAWTLPLFAIVLLRWLETGARRRAALAGVVAGLTVYVDYYLALCQLGMAVVLAAGESRTWTLTRTPLTPRRRRAGIAAAGAALVVFVFAGIVAVTGGFETSLAGLRVSARNVFNPLQIAWVVALAAGAIWFGPRLRGVRGAWTPAPRVPRTAFVALGTFVLVALPILWRSAGLAANGDYVVPPLMWRSGPPGVDAVAFLAGSPFHPVWGGAVQALFEWMGSSPVEAVAWLGAAPLLLLAMALARLRDDEHVRRWAVLGGVAVIWALGPHLLLLGHNTALVLPQAVLRYLPILSNARIPGRAMIVVYLALAVLCAIALAKLAARGRRAWPIAIVVLVLVDFVPVPRGITTLERSPVYDAIRAHPSTGAVLHLPLGLRDGFGVTGAFYEDVLWAQMQHGRAIGGGFSARIPPSVRAFYEEDRVLETLLALSGEAPPDRPLDPAAAASHLSALGFRFIVIDRARAPAALAAYADGFGAAALARHGDVEAFVLHDP
jgi:hypothetical protein